MSDTNPNRSQPTLLQQPENHPENPIGKVIASQDFPFDTTLKLESVDTGDIGWAHYGPQCELLSAYSRIPLDESLWRILEENDSSASKQASDSTPEFDIDSDDYPYGTTVKLEYIETGVIGWAHRGENGELLSAHSRILLDVSQWEVLAAKNSPGPLPLASDHPDMRNRYWEMYGKVSESARYCFKPKTEMAIAEGHLAPAEYEEFGNIYNALSNLNQPTTLTGPYDRLRSYCSTSNNCSRKDFNY